MRQVKTDKRKGQSVFNNIVPALGRLVRRGALLGALLLAGAGSAWAQWTDSNGVVFTAISGNPAGNNNEGWSMLCDGSTTTKYCANQNNFTVVVEASLPVKLTGYSFTTANDNSSWNGRNPKNWTISGSIDGVNWTTIATVTNDNVMKDQNYTEFSFTCSTASYYKYFRLNVTATQSATVFQLSEFHLFGDKSSDVLSSSRDGYVLFSGSEYLANSADGTSTFEPSTCIWRKSSNESSYTNGTYYLRNNNSFLTSYNNRSTSVTLGGTESGTTGQTLRLSNYGNYLRYNNGSWSRNNNASNVVFAVTKYEYGNNSVKPAVNSGPTEINQTGTSAGTYGHTNDAKYEPACIDYVFYNGTHHYCVNDSYVGATRSEAITSYEWVLEDINSEYATINNNGFINYKKSVSSVTTATVKVVAVTANNNRIESDPYYVTFNPTKLFYISITATAGEGGSVSTTPATLPTVLYGEYSSSKSASTNVTFTATPSPGYAFVKWVGANEDEISTDNPLIEDLKTESVDPDSPTAYTRKAVFQELPKFYYKVKYTVNTQYADGSSLTGQPGGTVAQSATDTKWIYGETLDASSATVPANGSGITFTATANGGFSFKNWKLTNTAVSENLQYTAGGFTVYSKNENSPTEITYTATFGEYPIFYVKIDLGVYEYLATTLNYNDGENKGNDVQIDVTLDEDGLLAIHATDPNQTSINKTINLTARLGDGFGFRGWSRTQVSAANIATGPYASSSSSYSIDVTANLQTKAAALASEGEHIYAYFQEFPIFYFTASTEVLPMESGVTNPGTASVDPTGIQEFHASSLSATEGTASYTFTASAKKGYKFGGWYKENEDGTMTLVSTYNPYMARIKSTSKDRNNPDETKLYAQFLESMESIEANDIVLDAESDGWLDITITPVDAWKSYIITSKDPGLVYVDNSGHCRSNSTPGTTKIHIQGVKTDGSTPEDLYTTVNATVRVKCKMPVISFSPSTDGSLAILTLTRSADDPKNGKIETTLYWTNDDINGTVTWHKYDGTVGVDPDKTVYAKSVMLKADGTTPDNDYTESDIAHADYVKPQVEKPSIIIDNDGVTFTSNTPGTIIYYYKVYDDINGDDPTTASYTGTWTTDDDKITTIASEKYIKVIGTKTGYVNSEVTEKQCIFASGISGNSVILNDYEDHTWTYYAGVSSDVDGGNYNTNYKGKLYSPNPRNVKITYKANGGAVSIDESQTEFIYYKTLEESATTGEYKYQVISNPFSKRPTGKGFGGWKITGGAAYIKNKNANDVLSLDEEITFESLPYPNVNCTSAEIELTATWVNANIQYGGGNINATAFNGGNYETNLLVINANYTSSLTPNYPVTIMMVEPDGSSDYRTKTFSGAVTPLAGAANTTKIEFANWTNTSDINAQGRNFTIGRGVTHSGATVYGTNSNANINQTFKIESGSYNKFYAIGSSGPDNNMTKQHIIFGNDYDRAKGDNTKMQITNNMYMYGMSTTVGNDKLIVTAKSGKFTEKLTHTTASASGNTFYLSYNSGNSRTGDRTLIIEGGEFWHIAGGYDKINSTDLNLKIRVKGGTIHGSIYGGAAKYRAGGSKQFVFTGGKVEGWIAGGSNGYGADTNTAAASTSTGTLSGDTKGYSYIYVGGNTIVSSNGSNTKIDESVGGNVFGAGCGNTSIASSGRMNAGTNVVVADQAEVERGVYGGGAYGSTPATANVYVTGVHVKSIYDSQNTAFGGVYGGARQKDGGNVNIYMTGGNIDGIIQNATHGGGLYGGSNNSGTLTGNVKMVVANGQVGSSEFTANVHGGGYGQNTAVNGNVDLSIGTYNESTATASGDAVIYGDVYGGSALGTVNDATSDHTYVTLAGGTIYGSLYGGGLGNATTAANVKGAVAVKVYGGSVKKTDEDGSNGSGGVYGANNINGAPQSTVTVDIYHTDLHNNGSDGVAGTDDDEYALFSVFGGGNQALYTNNDGYPKVTVHYCDNSIYRVYGGGNKAKVSSTDVTINGGNVIGRVFGGCRGSADSNADVDGNVNLKIYGGRILKAYGGNDSGGEVKGDINLLVSQTDYTKSDCPIVMDYLYGGGNNANSKTANMDIRYAQSIDYVFGGACSANMTGSINLNIVAGNIGTVFGGNDQLGDISGDNITVTVNWWDDLNDEKHDGVQYSVENNSLGSVYGGGNIADYDGSTIVKVLNATMTGSVYGGGKKADIGGSTNVIIGDWSDRHNVIVGGDVYGGGDKAAIKGSTSVTINDCGTLIMGDVYGGGNAAEVGTEGSNSSSTTVTVWGGTMDRVFGGGHGYPTADPPIGANIYGNTNVNFYGGTANGIFGGSNSVGNITGTATVYLDQQLCPTPDDEGNTAAEKCELNIQEVYGAGNEAYMEGEPVLTIGCVDQLGEIYGGARNADISRNIVLNINSGTFRRVFGGNNEGGQIHGSITVNVKETGCYPIIINELYGCGNQAAYNVNWQEGDTKVDPQVNIISCTSIGTVYGGGLGEGAVVTGNPIVHVDMVEGGWSNRIKNKWGNKLGTIGTVFGGGNAAEVDGETQVNIGTEGKGVNISNNVYGGGNAAPVTGKTHVQIGQ